MKYNASIVSTLSTVAFTAALGVFSSSAHAFTFTLNSSSGTWDNVIGGSDVTQLTFPSENQVRWGKPHAYGNGKQSGLGFTGAGAQTRNVGEAFLLGTLRHFNNVINLGTGAKSVDLAIELDLTIAPESSNPDNLTKAFSFTLGIDETPNDVFDHNTYSYKLLEPRSAMEPWEVDKTCKYQGNTSCTDRIFPTNTIPQDSVEIDGANYTLEWISFSSDPNRPLIIPGLTEEGESNLADLYVFGKIVDVEDPTPTISPPNKNLTINEGDWFNFNAGVTDSKNSTLSFEWDLDNDGEYDDFSGPSGQWSFADEGINPIGLKVSDGDGGSDLDSFEVTVKNVAPTLTSLTENLTVWEDELFSFAATAFDPGKHLHKINYIFFTKIVKHFFEIFKKTVPVFVSINFNPLILNKFPENFD